MLSAYDAVRPSHKLFLYTLMPLYKKLMHDAPKRMTDMTALLFYHIFINL